jgi:hypothetical protein
VDCSRPHRQTAHDSRFPRDHIYIVTVAQVQVVGVSHYFFRHPVPPLLLILFLLLLLLLLLLILLLLPLPLPVLPFFIDILREPCKLCLSDGPWSRICSTPIKLMPVAKIMTIFDGIGTVAKNSGRPRRDCLSKFCALPAPSNNMLLLLLLLLEQNCTNCFVRFFTRFFFFFRLRLPSFCCVVFTCTVYWVQYQQQQVPLIPSDTTAEDEKIPQLYVVARIMLIVKPERNFQDVLASVLRPVIERRARSGPKGFGTIKTGRSFSRHLTAVSQTVVSRQQTYPMDVGKWQSLVFLLFEIEKAAPASEHGFEPVFYLAY